MGLKAALADFFVIERPFATAARVKRAVTDSDPSTSASELEALLFFATPKQQSWFVASPTTLHCVIDSRESKAPSRVWSTSHEAALQSIDVDIRSPRSGTVTIAGKRPRLFSRKLFADQPLEERLEAMLERARSRARSAA